MFKIRRITIHFELGKNHLALKDYKRTVPLNVTTNRPTNKWFWVGMYDVDYETKDYALVKRLKDLSF
jgi:hypothetical protein